MKVLVTGGSGFLGRRVVPRLVADGHTVAGLARSAAAAEVLREMAATPVVGDLDRPETLEAAFRSTSADALVNLATLGSGHGPPIVTAAEDARIGRAVFISTTAIFTKLRTETKAFRVAAERSIEHSTLRWTILRPTMIYGGPDDRNMARLLRLLRRWRFVPLPGGGRKLQQPVHVDDLAGAVVAALDCEAAVGRTYDLAGPEPLTLRGLIEQAGAAVGTKVVTFPVPMTPTVLALLAYERLSRAPRMRAEQIERLGEDKAFDISGAERDLGFRPRAFGAGIAQGAALIDD